MNRRHTENNTTPLTANVKAFDLKQSSTGVITALATPFTDDGKVDVNSYVKLCKYQQENNVSAILALGTTAEAQLLTECERKLLVTLAKKTCSLPLMAGIEEPSTAQAVKQAKRYAELGADALMVAPPCFCKCTPAGYVEHIERIASASKLPVVLYNIPARASYALDVSAVKHLAESGCVKYVKDSSPNMDFINDVSPYVKVLCGSDEQLAEYMQSGAAGVVSVVSNVAPSLTKQAVEGKTEAKMRFKRLAELAMSEINPIAIKYLLCKAGIFASYEMRLPLTRASEITRNKIDELWEDIK